MMLWDTADCGLVSYCPSRGFWPPEVKEVYRAQCDGLWRTATITGNTLACHNASGPASFLVIDGALVSEYVRDTCIHRTDGPAQVTLHGPCMWIWYHRNRLHRVEGPAIWYGTWFVEDQATMPRSWERRARRLRWLLAAHI